jgi:hypothetical protein
MNEGDHAPVAVLVGAKPHQSQFASGDKRLQRVATDDDDLDSLPAIVEKQRTSIADACDGAPSDGRKLAGFLRLQRRRRSPSDSR